MSLLPGVNYVGGREDGYLTSPSLEWTGLHTLFATPSQFAIQLFLLPQLQLDGDVLRVKGVLPVVMPPLGGDQPCPGNRRRLRDLSGHPWNHGLPGRGHGSRLARCLNPKGSKGNGPGSSALLGGVRKSVQAVQILDAFSSAPAGGGDQPGSLGCWGSPAGSP